MGNLSIHEVRSTVIYEYFEADVMGILSMHEVTSCAFEYSPWVFWIIMKWRHGYFKYSESAVMGILKAGVMGILNIHSDIGILNILEVTSLLWIFKKPRNFEYYK